MTPADFAADVRELADCRTTAELEQRAARLSVRMETCKQEPCKPIGGDVEDRIVDAIVALQGEDPNIAPYRRTAAWVVEQMRSAVVGGVSLGTTDAEAERLHARIEQLEAELAEARVTPAKQAAELALALGFPDAVPPWLMLLALLRARPG